VTEILTRASQVLRDELSKLDPSLLIKDDAALPTSLMDAVHEYCEAGQNAGLAPEVVLRQLKEFVAEHYGNAVLRSGAYARDIVWDAVQRCIRAYFRTHARGD
jgi:hypothetical protein